MSNYTGREGKIQLGSHTVLDVTEYSVTVENPVIEEATFGNDYSVVKGHGIKSAGGSMTVISNSSDTTGQDVIEQAALNGTKITDFKLFLTDSKKLFSDTGADGDAGIHFSGFNSSISAGGNDMIKASFDFRFTGAYDVS